MFVQAEQAMIGLYYYDRLLDRGSAKVGPTSQPPHHTPPTQSNFKDISRHVVHKNMVGGSNMAHGWVPSCNSVSF